MVRRIGILVASVLALSGCAIQQVVKPVEQVSNKEMCVIENSAVRASFLSAYKQALTNKGFTVRQLPATAAVADCAMTSTYSANWSWDLALYMSLAEIQIYNNGKSVGEARYDARSGGASLAKFIDATKKIEELVDQLFPAGKPSS